MPPLNKISYYLYSFYKQIRSYCFILEDVFALKAKHPYQNMVLEQFLVKFGLLTFVNCCAGNRITLFTRMRVMTSLQGNIEDLMLLISYQCKHLTAVHLKI